MSRRLLRRFLRFFFSQLYHSFAWSYDIVAWMVSLGKWKEWVAVAADEITGPQVLELGHGPGHLQIILAEKGIKVVGIDSSCQMSRIATRNLQKADLENHLVRCRAEQLPFRDERFNQIVATFPSEYIFNTDTLSEAYRVLYPGGTLVILPAAWITGEKLHERFAAWLFDITGQAPSPDAKMLQPFTEVGFSIEEKWLRKPNWKVFFILARKPHPPT